jgi:hypothetical protein
MSDELPLVAGRRLVGTIEQHERACLCLLREEQEKILPDPCLVNVLCDAVRLAREYVDSVRGQREREAKG